MKRRIEIVHESLLAKWPRLVHWQTQDAEGAQLRDELRQAAHLWEQHDRSEDFLWTGSAYRDFQHWREHYAGKLTEVEQRFAEAVLRVAQRRRRRRLAVIVAALALAAVITSASVLLWRRAETQARRADAQKLLALAELELDSYPTAALAYATKSIEVFDNEEARRFLVKALWKGPPVFILPLPSGTWYHARFSPNEKWLVASSIEENVLVFPSSGERPIVFGGLAKEMNGRRHSEIAGTHNDLLISSAGGAVRIWSLADRKLIRRLDEPPGRPPGGFYVRGGYLWTFFRVHDSWSFRKCSLPDCRPVDVTSVDSPADFDIDQTGTLLAVARGHGVFVRPVEQTRAREQLIGSHPDDITWIMFGPHQRLLSQGESGETRIWAVDRGAPRLLHVIAEAGQNPDFDGLASRVAAADRKAPLIRTWNIAAPSELEPLQLRRGDVDRIHNFEFSPGSSKWLTATDLTSVSFWPLTPNYPRVFRGHTDVVMQVRFAPNGHWVVSGSSDRTVRLWNLEEPASWGSRPIPYASQPSGIYGLSVDPTSTRILITCNTGTEFLATADGKRQAPLNPRGWSPTATAFDRTGRRAAVGTQFAPSPGDRVIRIWDVATGAVLKEFGLLEGRPSTTSWDWGISDMRFASDGSLYTAGFGGVRRWDIDRGVSRPVLAGTHAMWFDFSDDEHHIIIATRKGKDAGGVAWTGPRSGGEVLFHDLGTGKSRTLVSHGSDISAVAIDATGSIAVSGSRDGTIRVGRVSGEEPHLLYGHTGVVMCVAVSHDGRWIASGGADGTVRVWPMPDVSKPPLHTLPRDQLIAKLKSLTNVRVVADAKSPNGYKLDLDKFPGWEKVPEW